MEMLGFFTQKHNLGLTSQADKIWNFVILWAVQICKGFSTSHSQLRVELSIFFIFISNQFQLQVMEDLLCQVLLCYKI